MKTAISLPDDLFRSADSLAERLGVSRSQLFATAVAEFLAKHQARKVTEQLNAVYARPAQPPRSWARPPSRPAPYPEIRGSRTGGSIWWADLPEPRGSEPGFRRPVLIVSADAYNRSRLQTVLAVVLTSNLSLVAAPGNTLIPARASGLPKDSVANVTQLLTLDRDFLRDPAAKLAPKLMHQVDAGLRLALAL